MFKYLMWIVSFSVIPVFHREHQRGMQLRIYILACLLLKGVSE